ncbi:MAG TPA: hypothetical protein EYN81_04220 [Candidatus Marinimicrobia bacterium]|nr:hypothetical protein [Candidatus Neomarinimicrobiota bacterium]
MLSLYVGISAQEITREAYNRFRITSSYSINSVGLEHLTLEKINGDIALNSDNQKQIFIQETMAINAVTEENALSLYLDAKAVLESSGNEVHLTGQNLPHEILESNYRIILPPNFEIMADLTSGTISVDGFSGALLIMTKLGDISLSKISSRTIASTLAGDLYCNNISGNTTFSTTAGNIKAEAIKGDLDVSGEGTITIDNVYGRTISVHTRDGDITVGNVNGETQLKTLKGDILVENLEGNLDLFSSNGDLSLRNINGDILGWTKNGGIIGQQLAGCFNFETVSGDILIQKSWDGSVSGHTIDATTNAGNIFLELPEEFPADFRVEVNNPEVAPDEAIISDFPLYIEATKISAVGTSEVPGKPLKVNLSSSFGKVIIRWSEQNFPSRFP